MITNGNHTDPTLDRITENLEMLTQQVGRLMETQTMFHQEFRDDMTEFRAGMTELKLVSQQQTDGVNRLIRIVSFLELARDAGCVTATFFMLRSKLEQIS